MPRGYSKRPGQIWAYDDDFDAIRAKFSTSDYEVTAKDGKKLIYKCHVVLEEANFYDGPGKFLNDSTREIVAQFLHTNDFPHKTAPKSYKDTGSNIHSNADMTDITGSNQVGKCFTVYYPTIEHFYTMVKGIQDLSRKYKLNGIPRKYFEDNKANLQYEQAVPGTNNILYYTLERIEGTAIDYPDRKEKMIEYYGEGPLDFLLESKNPSPVRSGLRRISRSSLKRIPPPVLDNSPITANNPLCNLCLHYLPRGSYRRKPYIAFSFESERARRWFEDNNIKEGLQRWYSWITDKIGRPEELYVATYTSLSGSGGYADRAGELPPEFIDPETKRAHYSVAVEDGKHHGYYAMPAQLNWEMLTTKEMFATYCHELVAHWYAGRLPHYGDNRVEPGANRDGHCPNNDLSGHWIPQTNPFAHSAIGTEFSDKFLMAPRRRLGHRQGA